MATILVVDDYLVTQKLLFFQLGKLGHQVVTADNGREALDYLKTATVDLIILDLVMPQMDGLTMLAHLRKDEGLGKIPVIMLTGSTAVQDREAALALGADAFMTKPPAYWELNHLVNTLLQQRSGHRHRQQTSALAHPGWVDFRPNLRGFGVLIEDGVSHP